MGVRLKPGVQGGTPCKIFNGSVVDADEVFSDFDPYY